MRARHGYDGCRRATQRRAATTFSFIPSAVELRHAHPEHSDPARPRGRRKSGLLRAASEAVVQSIAAPLSSVRIVLHEVPAGHVIVAGEIGKRMAQVDVALIEGRDEAKKAALIAALNQAVCGAIGISGEDVRVLIRDVPKTDMGVANGLSAKAAGR